MNFIIYPIALLVIAGATYVVKLTLERLDTKIEPFYEFDISFPKSGKWSIVFFLVIVAILTVVVLLSSGQQITLQPA